MLKQVNDSARRYFTGEPCKRGHIAERWTRNKTCVECNRECRKKWRKNLTERYNADPEFHAKRIALGRKWRDNNKEKIAVRRRHRWANDPEYREKRLAARRGLDQRATQLKTHYGITLEQFKAMRSAQNNRCAICAGEFTGTPHVDHCHKTERVRGLLCSNCNRGLGCFADNPTSLVRASAYLASHAEKQRGS